jgi:hypothetical protein
MAKYWIDWRKRKMKKQNAKTIIVNIILILLFPLSSLVCIQAFSPEIGDLGNWLIVLVFALFALVVWIRDERKQSKEESSE